MFRQSAYNELDIDMNSAFNPDELKRLNQTAVERLLDWAEENFKRHDYGPKRGRPVGFQLMTENEDELYTFMQRLTPEEQEGIRRRLRLLEGQCHLLELLLGMLEPGYETTKQTQERLAVLKRRQMESRRSEQGL